MRKQSLNVIEARQSRQYKGRLLKEMIVVLKTKLSVYFFVFAVGVGKGRKWEEDHQLFYLLGFIFITTVVFLQLVSGVLHLNWSQFFNLKTINYSDILLKNQFYSLCSIQNEFLSRELIEKERDLERGRTILTKFQNKCKLLFLIFLYLSYTENHGSKRTLIHSCFLVCFNFNYLLSTQTQSLPFIYLVCLAMLIVKVTNVNFLW